MLKAFYKNVDLKTIFSIIISFLVGFVCIFTGSTIIKKESLSKLNYIVEQNTHIVEIPFQLFEKSSDNLTQIISNLIQIKQNRKDYLVKNGYKAQLNSEIRKFFTTNENIEQVYLVLDKDHSLNPPKTEFYFNNKQFEKFNPKNKEDLFLKKLLYTSIEKKTEDYKSFGGLWSNSFLDPDTNKYMISYKKFITYENKNIGYIIVKISIDNYLNHMANTNVFKNDFSFFIDNHFCFISNETAFKKLENNKEFLEKFKQSINKNHRSIIYYKNGKTPMVSGFEKMSNGFIYVITASEKEIFSQEQNLRFLIASIFAMGVLFYILIILNI